MKKLASRVALLATLLFASSQAQASTFVTVCGYMPSGEFTIPVEKTLTGSGGYPTCDSSISETRRVTTVQNLPGGGRIVHTDWVTVSLVLVYELQGGY